MKKIAIIFCILFSLVSSHYPWVITHPLVLLSPYGNALTPGHQIGTDYIRDLDHSFAHSLGAELHQKQICTAALTHEKKDTLQENDLISLINNRKANLLFKIFFHHEPGTKPTLSIYFLTYNPLTDGSYRAQHRSSLIPLRRAHSQNMQKTKTLSQLLSQFLTKEHSSKLFLTHEPRGIPLTALAGILCPTIALDIGISHPDQQKIFIEPLAQGIAQLIQYEK